MSERRAPKLRKNVKKQSEAGDDTNQFQDSICLTRYLLNTWAWHPKCPLARSTETVPVEFGVEADSDAAVVSKYKGHFRPFILDEATASLSKEVEEEMRAGRVFPVRLRSVANIGDGLADVACSVVGTKKKPSAVKKLREGAIVFLCSSDPSQHRNSFRDLCNLYMQPEAKRGALVAGWVKFSGRSESEGMVLEVQHGVCDESAGGSPDHPGAACSPILMNCMENSKADAPRWYVISCSAPVTSQREMAALEAMCRRPEMQTLLRPSPTLKSQGCVAHRVWPAEVRALSAAKHPFCCTVAASINSHLTASLCCCSSPLRLSSTTSRQITTSRRWRPSRCVPRCASLQPRQSPSLPAAASAPSPPSFPSYWSRAPQAQARRTLSRCCLSHNATRLSLLADHIVSFCIHATDVASAHVSGCLAACTSHHSAQRLTCCCHIGSTAFVTGQYIGFY